MRFTKKAMVWLLMLTLALLVPGALAELVDGIYEATAPGMNGDITVHAAVMGGEIVKITADHSESAEFGAPAIDELIRRAIDVQDPDVDIVTGATQTSEAFVEAMKAALTQAGWEEEDFEWEIIQRWTPSPEPTPEPTPVPVAEISAPQLSLENIASEVDGVALISGDTVVINWHTEGDVQGYHLTLMDAQGGVVKQLDLSDTQYVLSRTLLSEGQTYALTVTAIPRGGTLEANGVSASVPFALYIAPTPEPTVVPAPKPTKEPASQPMLRSDVLEGDWYKDDYVSYVLGNESVQRKTIRAIRFVDGLEGTGENAWDVSAAMDGSALAWVDNGTLTIAGRDGVTAPGSSKYLFARYDNLESIDFNGCFNTGKTTDMERMFAYCKKLESLDASGFDTHLVTNMVGMFERCTNLATLDVGSFDTSNVVDIYNMFDGCSSLTNIDVSGFETGNVREMAGMFEDCSSLERLDLSGFDTHSLKGMSAMFWKCSNLTDLDLSSFDTSKVSIMQYLFAGCSSLAHLNVSSFDTGKVTSMGNMFQDCSSLTDLDVSGFDTRNVEHMENMFNGCANLTSIDVSGFDTQNVTYMYKMFAGCTSLKKLDVRHFDTRNVIDMTAMFRGCDNLKNLDVSGFDKSSLQTPDDMF